MSSDSTETLLADTEEGSIRTAESFGVDSSRVRRADTASRPAQTVYSTALVEQLMDSQELTTWQNIRKYIARFLCLTELTTVFFPLKALMLLTNLAMEAGIMIHNSTAADEAETKLPISPGLVALTVGVVVGIPTLASTFLNGLLGWSAAAEKIAVHGLPLPDNKPGRAAMIISFLICTLLPAYTFACLAENFLPEDALAIPELDNVTAGYKSAFEAVAYLSTPLHEGPLNDAFFAPTFLGAFMMMVTNFYLLPYAYFMAITHLTCQTNLTDRDKSFIRKILDARHLSGKAYLSREKAAEDAINQDPTKADFDIFKAMNKELQQQATAVDGLRELFSRLIAIPLMGFLLGGFLTVCDFIESILYNKLGDPGLALALAVNLVTLELIAVFSRPTTDVYKTFFGALTKKCGRGCATAKTDAEIRNDRMLKEEGIKVALLAPAGATIFPAVSNTAKVILDLCAKAATATGMTTIAVVNTLFFNSSGTPRSLSAFLDFFKSPPCKKREAAEGLPKKLPSYYAGSDMGIAAACPQSEGHSAVIKKHGIEAFVLLGGLALIAVAAGLGWLSSEISSSDTNQTTCDPNATDIDHTLAMYQPLLSTFSIVHTLVRILTRNHLFKGMNPGMNIVSALFSMIMPITSMVCMQYVASLASNGEYGTYSPAGAEGSINMFTLAYVLSMTMLGSSTDNFIFSCFKWDCLRNGDAPDYHNQGSRPGGRTPSSAQSFLSITTRGSRAASIVSSGTWTGSQYGTNDNGK